MAAWNVPQKRRAGFVGRQQILAQLEQVLRSGEPKRMVVICGEGGVGKTELAIEYAYRCGEQYELVWWMSAQDAETATSSYARLARHLKLNVDAAPLADMRQAVRHELSKIDKWLLIFDGIANPEALRGLLPPNIRGRVLVTSRHREWGNTATSMLLPPFERSESLELLKGQTGSAEPAGVLGKLAEVMGDLPLALQQAAACIVQSRTSCAQYLREYEDYWAELLAAGVRAEDAPGPVGMAWELSLRHLGRSAPESLDLLGLCAFLSEHIERGLLMNASELLPEESAFLLTSPAGLDECAERLASYSLATADEHTITVHPLIAEHARRRLSADQARNWSAVAVKLINSLFVFDSSDPGSWDKCSVLLPHGLTAARHAQMLRSAPYTTINLLNEMGRYLYRRGQYAEAKEILERAMSLGRQHYREQHPRLSAIANNLARVLTRLGDVQRAIEHFNRAMAADEAFYGQADPHIATLVNNYGKALQIAGNADAAKQQFAWALAVYEAHYGDDSAKVATLMNNLGYAMKGTGDLDGARKQFERALTIAEGACGPSHPTVAVILYNLGRLAHACRELESARGYLQRALDIDRTVFGEDHPDVARDLNELGELLQDLGELPEARHHLERALAILQGTLGEAHPRTAATRKRMASIGA